jgi:hypothetical protein
MRTRFSRSKCGGSAAPRAADATGTLSNSSSAALESRLQLQRFTTSEDPMADFTAIHSVGKSLEQFLENSFPQDLKTKFSPVKFQLVASAQIAEEDHTALDQLVTIFLHRITINENFRAATCLQNDGGKKPVLFVDLHYLITYWGVDPEAEQTILGWVMTQLQSSPILDNSVLVPSKIWGRDESVQLVPADLSLEDILRIWDALGPKYRLSLCYIARVVRLDVSVTPGVPVVATRFQYTGEGQ